MEELEKSAVKAALNTDWDNAVLLNKKILKIDSDNIEALLRLSYAFFSKSDLVSAKKIARQVIKRDDSNKVAKKLIEKCDMGKKVNGRHTPVKTNLKAFSVNYGNTKLVKLVLVAPTSTLITLIPGESLDLVISPNKVSVETCENVRIGRLPDDIASHVWSNRDKKHEAVLKSVDGNNVSILLCEK